MAAKGFNSLDTNSRNSLTICSVFPSLFAELSTKSNGVNRINAEKLYKRLSYYKGGLFSESIFNFVPFSKKQLKLNKSILTLSWRSGQFWHRFPQVLSQFVGSSPSQGNLILNGLFHIFYTFSIIIKFNNHTTLFIFYQSKVTLVKLRSRSSIYFMNKKFAQFNI